MANVCILFLSKQTKAISTNKRFTSRTPKLVVIQPFKSNCSSTCIFVDGAGPGIQMLQPLSVEESCGRFVLNMTNKGISESQIDSITHNVREMFEQKKDEVCAKVLASHGLDVSDVFGDSGLDGLMTPYMRNKYFREQLGLLVSALKISE